MDNLRLIRSESDDLERLVKVRVDFCLRESPALGEAEAAAFARRVEDWTRQHLETGDYVGYLGFLGSDLVCGAGLLLFTLPPLVSQADRVQGHVLSFFTYPAYRSRGIGRALMDFLVNDARALGVKQLVLNATPEGESLYEKVGFSDPRFRAMTLNLTSR